MLLLSPWMLGVNCEIHLILTKNILIISWRKNAVKNQHKYSFMLNVKMTVMFQEIPNTYVDVNIVTALLFTSLVK